jgi:DOPA 4,5-dioxygenase
MADPAAPWHAHIYHSEKQRAAAESLRALFVSLAEAGGEPVILFVGRMMDEGVGPHPIPQFEVHFREANVPVVVAAIEATGLTALVHPLTHDDLADHTTHARWIGAPIALDVTALDPPGVNQGIPRFGITDF